jgi:phosphatidylserine/phosphatidylglycerophosphate/cardiolipin synthase-like enzyme
MQLRRKNRSIGDGNILEPGRNCCGIEQAQRAAVLIDADIFFRRLAQAMRSAKRLIWIIGWDFDGSIKLECDGPPLGDFLRSLVEREPELEIRILIWNLATLHTPSASMPLIFGEAWQQHPRIHIKLDHRHPFYASQHQKLIAIDGNIAFGGGMDLTINRWDTQAHEPRDARRTCADGKIYEPVHDVHVMVEGPISRVIANIIRHQWKVAIGEALPEPPDVKAAWPDDLEPDFVDAPVAVSRTLPPWADGDGIREIAALNLDALRAAKHAIYIEAQYFAERHVGSVLRYQLRRADGPEVILLINQISHGGLESWVMGGNRNRIVRRLKRADRFGRLRVVYPVVADGGDNHILVHSKVIAVDDRFIKIGSSNLNRRSLGLDTECDLSIEAGADEKLRGAVARIRDRLLGEHLGVSAERFAEALGDKGGSLIAALDALNHGRRCLRPYSDIAEDGPTSRVFGTYVLDPREPVYIGRMISTAAGRLYSACVSTAAGLVRRRSS